MVKLAVFGVPSFSLVVRFQTAPRKKKEMPKFQTARQKVSLPTYRVALLVRFQRTRLCHDLSRLRLAGRTKEGEYVRPEKN